MDIGSLRNDLSPGETDGVFAKFMNCHRHERNRFLFSGGKQHVHFARAGLAGNFLGQFHQFIGLMPPRTDDDHDVISRLQQRDTGVTADVAGAAGDQDRLHARHSTTWNPLFVTSSDLRKAMQQACQ